MLRRLVTAAVGLVATAAFAGTVTIPNAFTANTPAVAAEVNANFNAVKTAVDDNDSRITALLATIQALEARILVLEKDVRGPHGVVAGLTAGVQDLQQQLDDSSVLELNDYLGLGQSSDPVTGASYPTAIFKGVNVQIVNGLGSTESINGLGNLTIGYNELHDPADMYAYPFCSKGEYTLKTTCEANGGIWARDQRSGSHSLVLGKQNSYTQYGGVVVGMSNVINGQHASVTAGSGSAASARFASVSGGGSNNATSAHASVSGGFANTASGFLSSVSGGYRNTASGQYSSVSGGSQNTASGDRGSVSGGSKNTASRQDSSVSGGQSNSARGNFSSVSGGLNRNASGTNQWRAGGLSEAN